MVAYQASGVMPKQLKDEKPMPHLTAHIWGYFLELSAERPSNGFGPSRITSTGIKDWCYVSGIKLKRWEIDAIRRLDNEWMKSQHDS